MALGIYYLHCFDPPVLHLDLKSANVLLDELGTAKVLCPYVDLYLTSTRQPYYVPTLLRANLTTCQPYYVPTLLYHATFVWGGRGWGSRRSTVGTRFKYVRTLL